MKIPFLLAAVVCGAGVAAQVSAQNQISDLDDLLRELEAAASPGGQETLDLEAQFLDQPELLDERLNEVLQTRAVESIRSDELEAQFEGNELEIANLNGQFEARLGSMRELFGVLQQVADEARGSFGASITNIEFPARADFLLELSEAMASGSQLPAIEDIERMWFELAREANELGKVKRLNNFSVITANGEVSYEDVVRVGGYNLVADGRYLTHNPETNSVSELQRQPAQDIFVRSTSNLISASPQGALVGFGLDPTGGTILGFLAETPTLRERIGQGRLVGYVIISLGIFGVLLSLERIVSLGIAGRKVKLQLTRDTPSDDNALGRVLQVHHNNRQADTETLELKLGEAILKETPALHRGILFIKIISVVAPLLGLLGTVTGMITTFQAITLFGTGDPRMMADGISQALVTTALGLTVAIPMVLLHTIVSGQSRKIVQTLQQQSAGAVARRAADKGT